MLAQMMSLGSGQGRILIEGYSPKGMGAWQAVIWDRRDLNVIKAVAVVGEGKN